MNRRQLGSTGLTVFPLGMGCSRLGSFLSSGGKREALATIGTALDGGIEFFDTSDIYAQGDSERLLGAAIGHRRSSVCIATKAGRRFSNRARLAARIKGPIKLAMRFLPGLSNRVRHARAGHLSTDFSHEYLVAALNASLKRLRTDYVDVFMLHGPPKAVLQNGELFDHLSDLVRAGKARSIGVSVEELDDARIASTLPGVAAIQLPVGPRHEHHLPPLLEELAAKRMALIGREIFDGIEPAYAHANRGAIIRQALMQQELAVVLVGMSSVEHLRANLSALK